MKPLPLPNLHAPPTVVSMMTKVDLAKNNALIADMTATFGLVTG